MYMAMFVLNDPDRLYEVLDAWEAEGISGITIQESTGLYWARMKFIPMRFVSPVVEREVSHLTLMAIVRDEEQVQACLRGAEAVVGDLSGANTGVFGAWPLSHAKGLDKEGR
jgi:hypothetical protein